MSNDTNEFIPASMREVWDWKRRSAGTTDGMTPEQLVEYYRSKAVEAEKKLGVHLRRVPASSIAQDETHSA